MAADGALPGRMAEPEGPWSNATDRVRLMAFVADAATETALRDGLADAVPEQFPIKRGGIRVAIAELVKIDTPRGLIVDITGEDSPLAALSELSQVVEPDVQVLVIGEQADVDFYREVTRGLGVREYLPKPLTRDRVMRLLAPVIAGHSVAGTEFSGGRVVAVTGARGGVGATTIAANLAWHFGVNRNRHTVLLDPNLHTGSAALYVDGKTSPGLRAALEMPERIDALFVERATQELKARLHVLAGQESMEEKLNVSPEAPRRLLAALRQRYNFIVSDVPFQPVPMYRDLLDLADQRVVVLEPMLAGVRDAMRLRRMYPTSGANRTVVVLNRMGMPGGLTLEQVEDALEATADLVIPDMPKRLADAANKGDPAVTGRSFFRVRVQDLARLVAFNRLVDAQAAASAVRRGEETRNIFARLLRRRKG